MAPPIPNRLFEMQYGRSPTTQAMMDPAPFVGRGEIRSAPVSWRDQMKDMLAGYMGRHNAEMAMQVADYSPIGAAFAGNEARLAYNRGSRGEAAAGVALAALPLPTAAKKGAGKVAREVAQEMPTISTRSVGKAPVTGRTSDGLIGAESPYMVSTRRPSAPNYARFGNPDEVALVQTGSALRDAPDAFAKNMRLLTEEPFMADMAGRSADEIYETAVQRGADNLNFIMTDLMPPERVQNARRWYPTAKLVSERGAARAGLPPQAGYGVTSVTSPQTPWDINVARMDRMMDMWGDRFSVDPIDARRYVEKRVRDANGDAAKLGAIAARGPEYAERIAATPFEELTNKFDQYARVTLADAARNDPMARKIDLDGNYGENYGLINFGNGDIVQKSLSIMNDPTVSNINQQLLGGGKVPSFYNNIAEPNSRLPIVTVDTHSAGAASLFPGGGKDSIVYRAMGLGGPNGAAADSAKTGAKGLYGPISDMHVRSAEMMGFDTAREVQSATWEGVRDLWGQEGKTPQLKAAIGDIWRSSRTPDEARYRIAELLGKPVRRVY